MPNNRFILEDDREDEEDEDELTEEGRQLWKNIADAELPNHIAKIQNLPVDSYQRKFEGLQLQIKKMIQNSINVVKDCDGIIEEYKTKQQYLAGDAKIAKTLHLKNIQRLTRLLNGEEVFDFEVRLPETVQIKPNPLYYKPRR